MDDKVSKLVELFHQFMYLFIGQTPLRVLLFAPVGLGAVDTMTEESRLLSSRSLQWTLHSSRYPQNMRFFSWTFIEGNFGEILGVEELKT